MSTDFPTAPLAPGHKGAGGGAVEKSHHASHTKNLTLPLDSTRDSQSTSRCACTSRIPGRTPSSACVAWPALCILDKFP